MTELKNHLRDINLEILTQSISTEIDISKRYNNKYRLFYPSRKLIKLVTEKGGVLTGSRALRCHKINGKSILERRCNDWDFIITLDMAYDICSEMNINQIPEIGNTISVNNQRTWRHPTYSDSYRVGIVDVHLIIRDELPVFIEKDKVRISEFGYALSKKVELTTSLYQEITRNYSKDSKIISEYSKHFIDLKQIIIKFNSIKNAQNR